jgi:hypothetical protein
MTSLMMMEAARGFGTFLTQMVARIMQGGQVWTSAVHRGIQAVPCASQFNPQFLRFVSYEQISSCRQRNFDFKIRRG